MEFNERQPIWLQIYEWICERILSGQWPEGERIPSVRECSATLQVNPNTAMRAYEKLQNERFVYNTRGIGHFVAEGARQRIREEQRRRFIEEELPALGARMRRLGITPAEFTEFYNLYQLRNDENQQ